MEPQLSMLGEVMPRLTTLRYDPKFSVAWDGEKLSYYQHVDRMPGADPLELARLTPEYFEIWGLFWVRNGWKFPSFFWRLVTDRLGRLRRTKASR